MTDFTREFETNIGREIKEMSKAGVLDPVLKTYLFAADRYIRTKIYEEDYNSKIILFDRYYQSALAYRMAENIDKNWVKNINRIFREPDMIFYIDITPQESIRRNTDTKFNIIEVVIHTLEEINKKMGKTILLVTHDPIIASSCDRIIFLKDGKVKEDLKRTGDKEQFYNEIITNWC
ncbi:MAG: hypothetical protein KHZ04_03695 [Dorea sp.]|uniref:dTMP kinase n=1 Tax=Dorea sp. TaxID=2040332 RepID=UPI00257C6691|nr:hypothetical protein [Dorea sp.]MBS5103802.1 hypothetical protein [Dorea sp.]